MIQFDYMIFFKWVGEKPPPGGLYSWQLTGLKIINSPGLKGATSNKSYEEEVQAVVWNPWTSDQRGLFPGLFCNDNSHGLMFHNRIIKLQYVIVVFCFNYLGMLMLDLVSFLFVFGQKHQKEEWILILPSN